MIVIIVIKIKFLSPDGGFVFLSLCRALFKLSDAVNNVSYRNKQLRGGWWEI